MIVDDLVTTPGLPFWFLLTRLGEAQILLPLVAAAMLWLWLRAGQGGLVLRWGLALLFFASAVFFDAYTRITNSYLTYSAFISMVYSGGFVQEAVAQYHASIMQALVRGLLLLFGVGLRPGVRPGRKQTGARGSHGFQHQASLQGDQFPRRRHHRCGHQGHRRQDHLGADEDAADGRHRRLQRLAATERLLARCLDRLLVKSAHSTMSQ